MLHLIGKFESYGGHLANMVNIIDACKNNTNGNISKEQLMQMMSDYTRHS
jgi:hypothetical protein